MISNKNVVFVRRDIIVALRATMIVIVFFLILFIYNPKKNWRYKKIKKLSIKNTFFLLKLLFKDLSLDPKSSASTNSASGAIKLLYLKIRETVNIISKKLVLVKIKNSIHDFNNSRLFFFFKLNLLVFLFIFKYNLVFNQRDN